MELDIDEGLLMTTIPKSVAVQTEAMVTTDASQQTEIHGRSIQTQTTQAILRPYPQELEHEVSLTMVSASHAISAASLKENDVKTKFYTGLLTWALFVQVFHLLSLFVVPSRTRLDLQDELILVLVKLRLNLPFQDLAY